MSLVVYAITDAEPDSIDGAGLRGRPLRSVAHGGLAAVVSDHDGESLEVRGAELWDHEEVVERLMTDRTILPMRFGTLLSGEPEVRALMRERHARFATGLDRVRGAVELAVSAGWREPPAPAAGGPGLREPPAPASAGGPGTAYMLDRVALHGGARELAARLDSLAALARDVRRRVLARGNLPVVGAYLVERRLIAQFIERVRDLDERHADIELVCTGPWPPYSFAAGAPV